MRVAVLGAGGQLAHDLLEAFAEEELVALTHSELDVTDHDGARKILADVAPGCIINTSAFHQVDACEDELEKAFEVNTFAVRNLAEVCEDLKATLVHISTDYVFDGESPVPYDESSPAHPLSVYGVSKLAGEEFVRAICTKHFVVRGSGLYGVKGASGKGGNFVETMIRLAKEGKALKVVDDQILGPTFTKDMAANILALVQTDAYGLYHITNSGECSWFDFTRKIFELTGLDPDFQPTTTEAYGLRAKRPPYSVLGHGGLARLGLEDLRSWESALADYLRTKGHIVE